MTSINHEFETRFKLWLDELDKFINNNITSTEPVFNQAQSRLINAGGKRIRSLLFLISSQADRNREELSNRLIEIAAAIEILHMATLVHDDIADQARLRRGEPSALDEFGSEPALFIGDYFLSKAYHLFFKNLSAESLKFLSSKLPEICAGQMSEFKNRYNYDITVRDYLKQVRRKTGLLFGVASYTGAIEAGFSKASSVHYYRYGLALGMAFQIQDDLLDILGDTETMGKPPLQDIRQGIYTLPVILLLEDNELKVRFIRLIESESYLKILELLENNQYLNQARKIEEQYFKRAAAELDYFVDDPAGDDLEFILNCQNNRRE
ncbi:polyprenyl synthetase family protein [Halanaerobiaceae bacterium Z-7014]|uniref:Polyprenyl synthetase family protein n=1 Tax=Halonatronomonas betaini TaxID=2778430 RepID=A0A931AVT9_9FIRM|nr:polyprenyl synthetase family protein [Halonatronomonas betaini]MBF8437041.1 polyprenyl synthetase family protein [Halonatronomonas betaini]